MSIEQKIRRLEQIKKDVENTEEQYSRARYALGVLINNMKEDFDCGSVDELKVKIVEAEKQAEQIAAELKELWHEVGYKF